MAAQSNSSRGLKYSTRDNYPGNLPGNKFNSRVYPIIDLHRADGTLVIECRNPPLTPDIILTCHSSVDGIRAQASFTSDALTVEFN